MPVEAPVTRAVRTLATLADREIPKWTEECGEFVCAESHPLVSTCLAIRR
jgi:hypothetical protein